MVDKDEIQALPAGTIVKKRGVLCCKCGANRFEVEPVRISQIDPYRDIRCTSCGEVSCGESPEWLDVEGKEASHERIA